MANIEISFERVKEDLKRSDLTIDQLSDILFDFGLEIDSYDESTDALKIEITAERIDLLSEHGFLRALKTYLDVDASKRYSVKSSGCSVIVDKSAVGYGNYTMCAIVKGLSFDDSKIKEIIAVQEKLHATYGRKRRLASLGIYPLDKIKFPIKLFADAPEKIKFVPLSEAREMTGKEIITNTETGREYANLVDGKDKYLFFIDSNKNILSMPPIINSEMTGRVTEETKDIFIECTGSNLVKLKYLMSILVTLFIDLGGEAYSLEINYPDQKIISPDLVYVKKIISVKKVNIILGIDIDAESASKLLKRMGYFTKVINKDKVEVEIPPYRSDVMHDYDIIDDIGRAYGFSNIKLKEPKIFTVGSLDDISEKQDNIVKIMTGIGLCEVMPLTLSSEKASFGNFNIQGKDYVSLGFSAESSFNIVSNWLIPKLFSCLLNNQHRSFPQKIFACDEVVVLDMKEETRSKNILKTACLIADAKVTFTEISAILLALCNSLGLKLSLEKKDYPFYISGRSAKVIVNGREAGHIGEVSPEVISNNSYSFPVAGFEVEI